MEYEEPTRSNLISSFQSSLATALGYVDDPTPREKRQVVYMREPDVAGDDFDGYPYLYLEDYSVSTENITVNEDYARVIGTAEIIIDAEDEDAESKMYHDELADEVFRVFLSDERTEMDQVKWAGVEIESDERSTTVRSTGKPILRRTISLTFRVIVDF